MFLCVLIGRVTQFVKELFVAREIGISPELDAFIIALLILTISLEFLFKPLGYALVPIITRLRTFAPEKANELVTKVILLSLGAGVLLLVVQLRYVDGILAFLLDKSDVSQRVLAKDLLIQLTPFFIFDILGFLFGIYLNAQNKNLLYSIYPAFPALFTIFYFLFIPLEQPIYQQICGFNIGSFVIFCLLFFASYQNGYRPKLNFKIDKPLKICFHQWYPLIFAALMLTINPMVDKKMAADLGIGSLSHLEYGGKIFSIFTSFSLTAITIVIYPFYSERIAQKDYQGIITFLKKTLKIITLPLIAGTAIMIACSQEFIKLLFERGAFLASDTLIVAGVMDYYILCFPTFTLGIIGVRLINALQFNKLVFYFSIVNLVLNIGLNYAFIPYMGLNGIALSTSVVYTVNAILVWLAIIWYFHKKRNLRVV